MRREVAPLHVLHVIDSGGLYGAERVLLALTIEQRHRGLASTIGLLRPAPAVSAAAGRAGTPCETIAVGRSLSGASMILGAAERLGARLIHSHGFKGNILLGTVPRRLRRGIKVVTTVHLWTETTPFSRMAWYGRLDRALLRRHDAVIFVHDRAARLHAVDVGALARWAVIENGVLPADARRRVMGQAAPGLSARIAELARDRPMLLAAARLSPEKGQRYLVDAAAQLRHRGLDVFVVLVGEGACRPELERRCRELGLGPDAVFMPGFSELDADILERASAFCQPSVLEGMPLVVIEAMQARLPIVATQVGGVPSVMRGYAPCWLVPPRDAAALATAIAAALEAPRGAAADSPHFSTARMASEYEAVYRDVLG